LFFSNALFERFLVDILPIIPIEMLIIFAEEWSLYKTIGLNFAWINLNFSGGAFKKGKLKFK
jgi:hypothetical protein